MSESDIDDDKLNSLLLTDSDDDHKPAAALRSAKPIARKSSGPVQPRPDREAAKDSDSNGLGSLEDSLFDGLGGPTTVKPHIKPGNATGKPPGKPTRKKDTKNGGERKVASPTTTSREEALQKLAEEEEAERSLSESIMKNGAGMAMAPSATITANPSTPVVGTKAQRASSIEFSSDDDFLAGLDDGFGHDQNEPIQQPRRQSIESPLPSSDNGVVNTGGYTPTPNTGSRRIPIPARAGRRALNSDEDSGIAAGTTNNNQPGGVNHRRSSLAEVLGLKAKDSAQPTVPVLSPSPSQPNPVEVYSTPTPTQPISPPMFSSPQPNPPSPSLLSPPKPQAETALLNQVAPSRSILDQQQHPVEIKPAKLEMNSDQRTSFSQQSNTPLNPSPTDLEYNRSPGLMEMNLIAAQSQIRQLSDSLAREKGLLSNAQSELESMRKRMREEAIHHQDQLLAQAKLGHDREIEIRLEEEKKATANIDHLNALHSSAMMAKDRLREEALESQRRIHEIEMAATKRVNSDGTILSTLSETVARSAQTIEGIEREVRSEISKGDELRRADTESRERLLAEKERKLQDDIKRHQNVIATFENLRLEHNAERMRLQDEETRIYSLQEFWINESTQSKSQITHERAALMEEKRQFERNVKDWKMETSAAQAEIAFLREKAQSKLAEAISAEASGQKAFSQAQKMILAEGEAARKERELASEIRSRIETDKGRYDGAMRQMTEQRRELEMRMREVMNLGQKVKGQAELVVVAYNKTQCDLQEVKRLRHGMEGDESQHRRAGKEIDEMRAFVQEEQRRMEQERVDLLRQRQKMIVERRELDAAMRKAPLSRAAIERELLSRCLSVSREKENEAGRKAVPVKDRKGTVVAGSLSPSDHHGHSLAPINLSPDQQLELFQLKLKAKAAAEYAQSEKHLVKSIYI